MGRFPPTPLISQNAAIVIPIAVLGTAQSGKTTFIQYLRTGMFIENFPSTLGASSELYQDTRFESVAFQLMDIATQADFEGLRKKAVLAAEGIIFLLDATNYDQIDAAKDLFWKFRAEANPEIPILFLVSKWDVSNRMSLPEICERINLHQFPSLNFHFCTISVRTGENIPAAIQWLTARANERVLSEIVELQYLCIYDKGGKPYLEIEISKSMGDFALLSPFLSAVDAFSEQVMAEKGGLQAIAMESSYLLFVKGDEYVCAVVIKKTPHKAKGLLIDKGRLIAETVLAKIDNSKNKNDEEIMNLLCDHFSSDLPDEDVQIGPIKKFNG
jgi:small GTP-binding protein